MKLATLCLGSCTGCHVSLLGLGEDIIPFLTKMQICYSPLLADVKETQECDLALIEGAPRNEEDLERLISLGKKAKTIIALGSCATYGGITGLGNITSHEELENEAYCKKPTETAKLRRRIYPLNHYTHIDWFLPGCPPPRQVIADTLTAIMAGKEPPHYSLPVCSECKRKAELKMNEHFIRTVEKRPEPDECMLSQGYICLGSVTRSGCNAHCTGAGVPCLGCRGPADKVLVEPRHGIYQDMIRRRSHLLGLTEKEVESSVYDLVHTLYAFTLSSPMMRKKKSEKVAENIHRLHLEPGEEL
jgi:F420-non-reducing hydrogenase small subunit